jgi:CBS domain-containing protein
MSDSPDINDFARENGPDATRNKIDAANNVVDFARRQQGKGVGNRATAADGRQIIEIKGAALAGNVKEAERILIALETEYVTQPDRRVAEIMTYDIISAEPETSVSDIAILLVHHRIKRVPIVKNGKLVGLVSRANIIEALAGVRRKEKDAPPGDHVRS